MSLRGNSNRFLTAVAIQAKKQSMVLSRIARLLRQKLPRNDESGVFLQSQLYIHISRERAIQFCHAILLIIYQKNLLASIFLPANGH